jgi:hypothetical protein
MLAVAVKVSVPGLYISDVAVGCDALAGTPPTIRRLRERYRQNLVRRYATIRRSSMRVNMLRRMAS